MRTTDWDEDHEFSGEPLDYETVAEVYNVTATSYEVRRGVVRADGTWFLDDEGQPRYDDRFECTRAGPTFASCVHVEQYNGDVFPAITHSQGYLARWNRADGGWREQLSHAEHGCDTSINAAFCNIYEMVAGFKQLPCNILSRGAESRPTTLPVLDLP